MDMLGRPAKWACFSAMRPVRQGLGQAGPLDVMRDVVTRVGIAPGTVGARGTEKEDDDVGCLAAWTDPRDRDMEA